VNRIKTIDAPLSPTNKRQAFRSATYRYAMVTPDAPMLMPNDENEFAALRFLISFADVTLTPGRYRQTKPNTAR
jgi:pectin methylesterase-like acyl-CoA thioesterase